MRKLFGFLMIFAIALGGAFIAWPDQLAAHWNALITAAESQLATEHATLDEIRSGKLKIGAAPQASPKAPPSVSVAAPASSPSPKQVKTREKTVPIKAAAPPIVEKPLIVLSQPVATPVTPIIPADATPEAALGAILKHETRENQAKEETFWTEERIQEALKNGAPKSRGAPCIAFCDKNNTMIEINMPKTPPPPP